MKSRFFILVLASLFLSMGFASALTTLSTHDYFDQCGDGDGLSSNGVNDACNPFITWHVHDMGELLDGSDVESLTAYFMSGWTSGCQDNAYAYVSQNIDGPWSYIGDTSYTPGGWQIISTSFFDVFTELDFRYVKIGNYGGCYSDWSAAGVNLKKGNDVPEFSTIAAGLALIGSTLGFVALRRRK
ncbi:MAG: hypothetical protein V1660_02815 [archaeon]